MAIFSRPSCSPSEVIQSLVFVSLLGLVFFHFPSGKASGFEVTTCRSTPTDRNLDTWALSTIPVGHGDAHVITSPGNQVTVVDAGSTETVDRLASFLERNGIERIDRLVITHPHWDHIGGSLKLMEQFTVGRLGRPGLKHPTDLVKKTTRKIGEKTVPVRHLTRGDTIPLGDKQAATVINPGKSTSGGLNQNSLAFHFAVGKTRVLMMGDVVGEREQTLLEAGLIPDADVLKIAHHGNASGTSEDFLRTVNPKLTVLPAPLRRNDPWGRPDEELLQRLRSFGIPTFHTGRNGLITVRFDSKTIRTVKLGSARTCSSNQG